MTEYTGPWKDVSWEEEPEIVDGEPTGKRLQIIHTVMHPDGFRIPFDPDSVTEDDQIALCRATYDAQGGPA